VPLRLGGPRIDLRVRRRLVELRHELALLERYVDVGVEAEIAVRGERLHPEPFAAVLEAHGRLLLVGSRAGQVAEGITLVVVRVVFGRQAPVRQRRRRPPHAAKEAVNASAAIARAEIELPELL